MSDFLKFMKNEIKQITDDELKKHEERMRRNRQKYINRKIPSLRVELKKSAKSAMKILLYYTIGVVILYVVISYL